MPPIRPWQYESRAERRRRESAEFWQYAQERFRQINAPTAGRSVQPRQQAAPRPQAEAQDDGGGGGFWGGVGDFLGNVGSTAVSSILGTAPGAAVNDIVHGYERLEGGLQSIAGVATGATQADRQRIPGSSDWYRGKPSWSDAFSSWGEAIRDPIGAFGSGEQAFEERLRNPELNPLERGLLGGITAPEAYATAGFGGPLSGAIRGSRGAAAPLYRRIAAGFAEPISQGGLGSRFAGELALETGARAGGELGYERFGIPGAIAGGLLGGIGGSQAYRGAARAVQPGSAVQRGIARAQGREGLEPAFGMGIDDVSGRDLSERILPEYTEPPVRLTEPPRRLDGGEPPEPPKRHFTVPEVGFDGANRAIADRMAAMVDELGGDPSSRWRKLRATISPSWAQTDKARVAHTAMKGTEARLSSDFNATMQPRIQRIKGLLESRPPQYIGPEDNPFQGTMKDIADNPQFYMIDGEWQSMLDDLARMWDDTTAVARAQYGVDIKPFEGNPGSAYLPTIPKKTMEEDKIDAVLEGFRASGRGKRRAYQSAYERWQANDKFVAETDLDELVAIHNRSIGRLAGQQTFSIGMGGKTRTEVVEELRPALSNERRAVNTTIEKLRGRLDTAERRIRQATQTRDLREKDINRLNAKRDRFLERMAARGDPKAVRQAAREALQEAVMELRLARDEAIQAARTVGREGASTVGPRKKLGKLAQQAEALARKAETARETRTQLESTLELDPGKPRAGEMTRDEIRDYWDQLRQLKTDIREAHTEEMLAFRGFGETQEEIGEQAETLIRREEAGAAQGAALDNLKQAENEAIARAKEFGESKDDAVLVAFNKRVDDLDVEAQRLGKELDKADVKAGDQSQLKQGIEEALEDLKRKRKELNDAYNSVNLNESGYTFSQDIHRYLPEADAQSVRELHRNVEGGTKTLLEGLNEVRQWHLSADASPIFIQTMLGIWANPKLGLRVASHMIRENPRAALQRIAEARPQDVSEYAFWTGKTFGQQTAEFGVPRGLRRFKLGGAWEDTMFAFVQRIQLENFINDRNVLRKLRPDLSHEAASREAARWNAQAIPQMLQMERGISPARGAWERGTVTSTSFTMTPAIMTKNMAKGMAKLAYGTATHPRTRWQTLTGQEQLAVYRGTTLAGSMMAMGGATAALAALQEGKDPRQAALDAFDPRSKHFMAYNLPGGTYVPIGGPVRGFYRSMAPFDFISPDEKMVNWAKNKLTSPVIGSVRLAMNEDWRGEPIREGPAVEQAVRSLMYMFEQVAPIFVGAPSEGLRTGQGPAETAAGSVGQFLGASAIFPTPNDKLNDEAYRRFGEDSFWDLEPHQQEKIKEQSPDLWNQSVAEGSDERQAATEWKNKMLEQQRADDEALLSGAISMADWRENRRQRGLQLRTANEVIYSDADHPERDRPTDRYYEAIDHFQVNGQVDWAAVDQWVASQPKEDQEYIERNTSLGGTELEKAYKELAPQRDEYFNISKYHGYSGDESQQIDDLYERARASLGLRYGQQAQDFQMARAIQTVGTQLEFDQRIINAARRRVLGMLHETEQRRRYLERNPKLQAFLSNTYLSPQQVELLSSA